MSEPTNTDATTLFDLTDLMSDVREPEPRELEPHDKDGTPEPEPWRFPSEHAAKRPEQRPSVGRIVHVVSNRCDAHKGGERYHLAAIVTYVWSDDTINAVAYAPNGEPAAFEMIQLDESAQDVQSWHWPERI